jgi:hypothetical protein
MKSGTAAATSSILSYFSRPILAVFGRIVSVEVAWILLLHKYSVVSASRIGLPCPDCGC